MKHIPLIVLALLCLTISAHAQNPRHYSRHALRLGLISGVNIGGEEATIKYANYTAHPYGMFGVEYFVVDRVALTGSLFAGTLSADFTGRTLFPEFGKQAISAYDSKYYGGTAGADWALPEVWRITPIGKVRIGGLVHHTLVEGEGGFERRLTKGALVFGFGGMLDYPLTPQLTVNLSYDLFLTNSDYIDGLRSGKKNDALSVITLGMNFLLQPGDEEPVRARAYTTRESRRERRDPGVRDEANAAVPARGEQQRETGNRADRPGEDRSDTRRGDEDGARSETPARREQAPARSDEPPARYDEPPARDQGLALKPEAPPEAVANPVVEEDVPLSLFTQLNVSPLRRLRDLEDRPSLFTLKVWQTGDDEMQLKSYVEILRDGRAIYQGNADLLLDGQRDQFTADEFLDLDELLLRNQGDALLPRGNYVVRVSTVAWDQELSSLAQGKFLNIDLRPIFGPRADAAREVIVTRAVDVSAEGDEDLLVNFSGAGQSAAEREKESGSRRPSRLREPLHLAPIGTVGAKRDALLADQVQKSFAEALQLQSIAGSSERAENLKVIVSEIYFPIDEDQLTDEARLILDNVARHLNQHPEQFAEVRGYANDIGDETYNRQLARRRADRVLEYLVRKKMHAYRISVADVERDQIMSAPSDDPRLGRKVEVVLKNRGM